MIESVGDLDEGVVGDGFFTLPVEEDTLGDDNLEALENMLRVGERFGVGYFAFANFLAEGELLWPADVLNKLRVGERFGGGDVAFGGVFFPFKVSLDNDREFNRGNLVLGSSFEPLWSSFFLVDFSVTFSFIIFASSNNVFFASSISCSLRCSSSNLSSSAFFFSSSSFTFKAIARSIASAASMRACEALSRSSFALMIEALSELVAEAIICASAMPPTSEDFGFASIETFSSVRDFRGLGSSMNCAIWTCFVVADGTSLICSDDLSITGAAK
mmetsp:Transcript_19937/g.32745  ORF Transcript_19937/g.32745 Transcript_19937/m.32745 type:complete len:273 (+) Transcript_19937:400-1218(+)